MAAPHPHTSDEDLLRHAEFLAEGWAFAATSRRRAGFGVARAGEDTLAARDAAAGVLGAPRLTVLHGQSWGGAVAARAIETLNAPGPDGRRPFDAALLTSAVLAGPSRAYDMRVDLRAAFQAVCGTHPAPHEAQYPVTLGLAPEARMARELAPEARMVRELAPEARMARELAPEARMARELAPEARMTREEVVDRYLACTGADVAPEARSPGQRAALADLVAASRVPEGAIPGHLWWATQVFADIARHMTGGLSAFGNEHVRYRGTSDDAAFNARVPRIRADPDALARLAADGDPTGRVEVPVLTLHGVGDATVFVENAAAYRATLEGAGTAHRLAQVFVDEAEHQKLSPVLYPAALATLADWAEGGPRPTPEAVRARCEALRATHPGECRVMPGHQPKPWEARVNPRRPAEAMAGR